MITLTLATLWAASNALSCPVMGGASKANGPYTDYNGIRFQYCCDGCDAKFEKEPAKYIAEAAKSGKTIGYSLFDPVSGQRVLASKAKASADYKGIRYYFETEADKTSFDASPIKFAAMPAKQSLVCPVMGSKIANYVSANSYTDYEGTRYYYCCPGCQAPFTKDPAKYVPNAQKNVTAPAPIHGKAQAK